MPDIIQSPAITDLISSNGFPTVQMQTWMNQITQAVLPPQAGSGSPEGVLVSDAGRWYVDVNAPTGSGIYFKQFGAGNTGWVQRS